MTSQSSNNTSPRLTNYSLCSEIHVIAMGQKGREILVIIHDRPQGYFTVVKHIYNDPNLRVSGFCKPCIKIVVTCQVYDMRLPSPRLIGVQYAITAKDYNSLLPEEKPNWYILDKNLLAQTQSRFPELNAQQVNAALPHLLDNYAKLIKLFSIISLSKLRFINCQPKKFS